MKKYFFYILTLMVTANAAAQNNTQRTPRGAVYQIYTHNTGDKIKLNDIVTFQFMQKTEKDSVVRSTYADGRPGQVQIAPCQSITDLMEVFPLLTVNDSASVKIPTDSIYNGHDEMRPAFFPKGSYTTIVLKIEKVQVLDEVMTEMKSAEIKDADKYIATHKLLLKTTPSGLKYIITHPTLKPKPLKGDTLLVNYVGRTVDEKVFDTSIESVAKASGVYQEGRPYAPYQLVVGAGGVIAGWDEGLLLLNEGSKATFVIPSRLAYGEIGSGTIRPFSTLVFDLELVKVKPGKHPVQPVAKKPLPKKKKAVKKTASK